jgi:putative transposase
MIDPTSPVLSISAQCDLLSVNRSRYYYVPVGESQENLAIMRQLDEQPMIRKRE